MTSTVKDGIRYGGYEATFESGVGMTAAYLGSADPSLQSELQDHLRTRTSSSYPQGRARLPTSAELMDSVRARNGPITGGSPDAVAHSHGATHGGKNRHHGGNYQDPGWTFTGGGPTSVLEDPGAFSFGAIDVDVNSAILKYPYDIAQNNRFAHAIKISIFKPATSQYQVNLVDRTPAITENRARNGQNINAGDGTALTTGTLVGLQTGINAYTNNVRLGSLSGKVTSVIAAATGGVAGGLLAAALSKNINLDRKAQQLKQNIFLYVPETMVYTQQHKYSETSATAALGALGYIAQSGASLADLIDKGNNDESYLNRLSSALGKAAGGPFGTELKNLLVGNAARTLGIIGENAQDLMLQSQGYAQNPQMEVLFDTTDFRQFLFDFNFMPRSFAEADEVMKIIKALRFYSAPELYSGSGGARYFIPPYYFELEVMQKDGAGNLSTNPHIPKITTCVLEQVDVDYVGESDRFTTHSDGIPVHIKMTLRFKEIEIIHKRLIDQGY